MAGHTPGPWTVHGQWQASVRMPNGEGFHVCSDPRHASDESKANARLIAAAPDMLAALEEIMDSGCDCDGCIMAGNVVAKARGEG